MKNVAPFFLFVENLNFFIQIRNGTYKSHRGDLCSPDYWKHFDIEIHAKSPRWDLGPDKVPPVGLVAF